MLGSLQVVEVNQDPRDVLLPCPLAQFLGSLKCILQHIPWDYTCRCFPLESPLFICFQLPSPKPGSSSYTWEIKLVSPLPADLLRCFQGCIRMEILS